MLCSFSIDTSSPSSPINQTIPTQETKETQKQLEVTNLFLTGHNSLFLLSIYITMWWSEEKGGSEGKRGRGSEEREGWVRSEEKGEQVHRRA